MLRFNSETLTSWVDSHIIDYPTAMNLNYAWSFGSIAGFCLGMQFISGAYLAMYYLCDARYAFASIDFIMREVKYGWMLRYFHANGASFFFMAIYCHILRGLYYGSFMEPRQPLWWSGVILYILGMATAFIGYVLPWGQMSFWGATVITSMLSIIDYVLPRKIGFGKRLLMWIWGAYVVNNKTLKRFFSIHYLLPFILVGLVFVHLGLLHKDGSNNPLGVKVRLSNINFYPYFYVKDFAGFFILLTIMSYFVFFCPNFLGDTVNYIEADPYKTPNHIVPEWYFLPFYAILRAIPHKAGGIIAMGLAIGILFAYPAMNYSSIRSGIFRPIYAAAFWMFLHNSIFLSWFGTLDVKTSIQETYLLWGAYGAIGYFMFFFISGIPLAKLENQLSNGKYLFESK